MVPSGKIYCQFKKYYENGFGADGVIKCAHTHTTDRQAHIHVMSSVELNIQGYTPD